MDQQVEQRIRALARPLWESAARPYGMAMDFWLMAEQMVLEMMAAATRIQGSAVSDIPRPLAELPPAMPVDQVRQLAECMWESAGRQYGMAQEFWLAAERHVMAIMRAAAASRGGDGETVEPWIRDLTKVSPAAYLDRIQQLAYQMWETTGRQYGQALDFWLEAEKQTLAALARTAATPPKPADQVVAEAHERQRQRREVSVTKAEEGDQPDAVPPPATDPEPTPAASPRRRWKLRLPPSPPGRERPRRQSGRDWP